jgi:hypothetical protein
MSNQASQSSNNDDDDFEMIGQIEQPQCKGISDEDLETTLKVLSKYKDAAKN